MTTLAPRPRRRRLIGAGILAVATLAAMTVGIVGPNFGWWGNTPQPNLTAGVSTVSCAAAHDTANTFALAVDKAGKATSPDYSGILAFGFQPPASLSELQELPGLLKARQQQLEAKAKAALDGTCVDGGNILPVVDNSADPLHPLSGSQANASPLAVPVTVGTAGDPTKTNSWGELDKLFGGQDWYTQCTDNHLGMNWGSDVPKFEQAEQGGMDTRSPLAANPRRRADQTRQRAADDGYPGVDTLQIVRTEAIINTRHLSQQQCDEFVDRTSQVRVSLAKVTTDPATGSTTLDFSGGVFANCHNMWHLQAPQPKPAPVPPTVTTTSSPPVTTTRPPSPPTTTTPRPTCQPPLVGTPPRCLQPKDPNVEAAHQGNAPLQAQGPAPAPVQETRPASPPPVYTPPPTVPAPPSTQRSYPVPLPEQPSNPPASGCVPAPGMTTC